MKKNGKRAFAALLSLSMMFSSFSAHSIPLRAQETIDEPGLISSENLIEPSQDQESLSSESKDSSASSQEGFDEFESTTTEDPIEPPIDQETSQSGSEDSEIASSEQNPTEQNVGNEVIREDGIYFDDSVFVQKETKEWQYQVSATQEAPLTQEQLLAELPRQVTIVFNGQEYLIDLENSWWDLTLFGDHQYQGEYKLILNIPDDALPEGYALEQGIEVLVRFDQAMPAKMPTEEQLEQHEVKTTVSPRGTTIDAFNYPDNLKIGEYEFNGGGGAINANKWTGLLGERPDHKDNNKKRAMANIVQNNLVNGYPALKVDGDPILYGVTSTEITQPTSLAPLFDGTYPGVEGAQGLLQVDEEGYFYYNSKQNHAVIDENTNRFKVYDIPRNIKDPDTAPNIQHPDYNLQGQFFPFNPVFYTDGNGEQKSIFDYENGQIKNNYTRENRSFHFGVHMSTRFIHKNGGYTDANRKTPVTYEFSGDDDVWVFIDGVLVGDVGGIHDPISLEINFATGEVSVFAQGEKGQREEETKTTLKECYEAAGKDIGWQNAGPFWERKYTFKDNSYHTLDFFYLERGRGASNMKLKYNLLEVPESSILKQDQIGEAVPGAEFELWSGKGIAGQDTLLARGTTDLDGTFILMDARPGNENQILSLKELYGEGFVNLTLRETKIPDGYRGQVDVPLKLVENNETHGVVLVNEDPWSTGVHTSPKVRTEIPTTAYIYTEGDQKGQAIDIEQQKNGLIFAVVQKRMDMEAGFEDPGAWTPLYGDREHGWHKVQSSQDALQDVITAFKKQSDGNYESQVFSLAANGVMAVEIEDLPGNIQNYYSMLPDGNKNETEYALGYYYSTSKTIDGVNTSNTWRLDSDLALQDAPGNQKFERIFATNILVPNIKNTLYVQKTDEMGNPLGGAVFSLYTEDQVQIVDGIVRPKDGAVAYDTITVEENNVLADEIEAISSFPSAGKVLKRGTYYLIEDSAPEGYIGNMTSTKVIVNDEGVYAHAGNENDGVIVARGVGGVVKSMAQFATDDQIDNTLFNIKTNMKVSDSESFDAIDWSNGGSPTEIHLQYHATNTVLEYGALQTEENPEMERRIKTDTGWSKLDIYQCLESHGIPTSEGASIENLGDKAITNLFSNTVTVIVENQRTNPLTIEKKVEDESGKTKLQDYTFNVHLSYGQDEQNQIPVTGTYPITITTKVDEQIQSNDVTKTSIQFDASGQATITLKAGFDEAGKHISQMVDILNLPQGIRYTVMENNTGDFTTKVKTDTQSEITSNTIQGVIERIEDATSGTKYSNYQITFTNIYVHLYNFEFFKTDKGGNPLKDVQFGLYELNCKDNNHKPEDHQHLLHVDQSNGDLMDEPCWSKVGTFTSNEEGKVLLKGLVDGQEYRLVEYQTAPGFVLPDGQWTIRQNEQDQFVFAQSVGNPPAVEQIDGQYYIHNFKPNQLPLTGDQGNHHFMMVGVSLMAVAVILLILERKRKIS